MQHYLFKGYRLCRRPRIQIPFCIALAPGQPECNVTPNVEVTEDGGCWAVSAWRYTAHNEERLCTTRQAKLYHLLPAANAEAVHAGGAHATVGDPPEALHVASKTIATICTEQVTLTAAHGAVGLGSATLSLVATEFS